MSMSSTLTEIMRERVRQIEDEGWDEKHDDQHAEGELAAAAACYAAPFEIIGVERDPPARYFEAWPWDLEWWKPKERRRDLVRAAALIVAEIERLDRKADAALPDAEDSEAA